MNHRFNQTGEVLILRMSIDWVRFGCQLIGYEYTTNVLSKQLSNAKLPNAKLPNAKLPNAKLTNKKLA